MKKSIRKIGILAAAIAAGAAIPLAGAALTVTSSGGRVVTDLSGEEWTHPCL